MADAYGESARKPISCIRDKSTKVNKVRFQLEDGKTYHYSRKIQIKPRLEEQRWFKVVGNEIEFLDEQLANPHHAYSARGFGVMGTSDVEQAKEFTL
jgi:hypothetical protein